MFGPLLVGHVVAKERLRTRLIGHSGPLLTATKDIDISEAAVLAKLDLDHASDVRFWWSCRKSNPPLYLGICLLNCEFVPIRSGSLPLITCGFVLGS